MSVNFSLSGVQQTLYSVWDWTAKKASYIGHAVVDLGQKGIAAVKPFLSSIAQKTQAVWAAVLPYLKAVGDFMLSKLGISSMLLGVTILCMKMARGSTEKPAQYTLWMIAGVVSAIASGALLFGSHLFPIGSFSLSSFRGTI